MFRLFCLKWLQSSEVSRVLLSLLIYSSIFSFSSYALIFKPTWFCLKLDAYLLLILSGFTLKQWKNNNKQKKSLKKKVSPQLQIHSSPSIRSAPDLHLNLHLARRYATLSACQKKIPITLPWKETNPDDSVKCWDPAFTHRTLPFTPSPNCVVFFHLHVVLAC